MADWQAPIGEAMGRRPLRSVVGLVLAPYLLLASCTPAENEVPETKSPSSSSATTAPPVSPETADTAPRPVASDALPQVPGTDPDRFDGDLAPILALVDPGDDEGWDSEVFSDLASKRLTRVVELALSGSEIDPASLSAFVAEDFGSDSLRPEELAEVFVDPVLRVLRPVDGGDGEAESGTREPRFKGREGLAAALLELRRPLDGTEDTHAKIKVIRVELASAAEVKTIAYVHGSGHGTRGGKEWNATWTCGWQRDPGARALLLRSISVSDYEEVEPGTSGAIRFTDCTEAAFGNAENFREQLGRGVDFFRGRLEASYGVDPGGHQGVALGDANGDGLDDVYVSQQGGLPNRLFLQNTDGTFRESSAEAGVDWMEPCRSALFVDIDNDGDQDLAMAQGWHFMVMKNDGTGKFTKVLEERSPANLYSTTAADFDNDGDLDLYVCGRNPGRELEAPEGILGTPIPYHDANNGGPSLLLENDGTGKFTEVTAKVGLDVNNRRYSYAASWEDYDNDGDLDLYVANDFGRNNLYRNELVPSGTARFTDVAADLGVEDISAGMSVVWGDYDQDGLMDVYVSNMFSSAGNRITYNRRFRQGADHATLGEFQRHARGNTLFRNTGRGPFEDVSELAGVTMGRWAWGSAFVDFNNDGLDDLYVANGFITTEDTGDL